MRKYNISYEPEQDDLFLYNPIAKSKGSVEFGDLVLDYNYKKELVGIQMLHASKFLSDFIEMQENKIKSFLKEVTACAVETRTKNNMLIIKIHFIGKEKEITPVISIPSLTTSSPALAYGRSGL